MPNWEATALYQASPLNRCFRVLLRKARETQVVLISVDLGPVTFIETVTPVRFRTTKANQNAHKGSAHFACISPDCQLAGRRGIRVQRWRC